MSTQPTKLVKIYVDDLSKPLEVIAVYDNWPDANTLAQKLNKALDLSKDPFYYKAICTKYDELCS